MTLVRLLAFAAMAVVSTHASAGLIAHYTFDDGTGNNSASSAYNLGAVGGTPNFSNQAYYSDGNSANYLQVAGPGGMPNWTLSLWLFTEQVNQGQFKGIFSNLNNNTDTFSWQIDSHNGAYRFVSANSINVTLGSAAANTWEHIVIQKFDTNNVRFYFNGNSVAQVASNPGGLQNFRVGINRASNNSFNGYIDNIQIWDDSSLNSVGVSALQAVGPSAQAVPAPATLLLFGVGLIFAAAARLRKS